MYSTYKLINYATHYFSLQNFSTTCVEDIKAKRARDGASAHVTRRYLGNLAILFSKLNEKFRGNIETVDITCSKPVDPVFDTIAPIILMQSGIFWKLLTNRKSKIH